jgi:hypothetical protein
MDVPHQFSNESASLPQYYYYPYRTQFEYVLDTVWTKITAWQHAVVGKLMSVFNSALASDVTPYVIASVLGGVVLLCAVALWRLLRRPLGKAEAWERDKRMSKDIEHMVVAEAIIDGLYDKVWDNKISKRRADWYATEIGRRLGIKDLLPRKRWKKLHSYRVSRLKEAIKSRLSVKTFDELRDVKPVHIPGPLPGEVIPFKPIKMEGTTKEKLSMFFSNSSRQAA